MRLRALRFFNANPDHFDLVFVANATAGIKLVAECFRELEGGFRYGYHRDTHTSLVGVREHAAEHHYFGSDEEVERWMRTLSAPSPDYDSGRAWLFAYPAQSNLNGRRLSLAWPGRLRFAAHSTNRCIYSLLDAAALVSTSPLDLSDAFSAPDFTVLSFYKIFGYPDLGALIIRKDSSLPLRRRRYFGGGTVEVVSSANESFHVRKQSSLHEQLEDGTLPIHSIIALDSAFDVHEKLFGSLEHISSHTSFLARRLYEDLSSLRHANGHPVCTIYKDPTSSYKHSLTQGPVIAMNLRTSKGHWISNAEVEKLAAIRNVQLRTGGLCNPGGVASFLDLAPCELRRNFSAGKRCGNEADILEGKPTGVIRLSLGAMSSLEDITAFVQFVEEFFVNHRSAPEPISSVYSTNPIFRVETVTIYPIKSCGGWEIPSRRAWDINPEGLAWDREWCLIHQGTRAALSQKRVPRMALIRPSIDFETRVLWIRYTGRLPASVPNEISVPLSAAPETLEYPPDQRIEACSASHVCGDSISAYTYNHPDIVSFFTTALGVPCTLARFPPGSLSRHSKLHLQRPKSLNQSPTHPTSSAEPSTPGAFPPTPPASPNHSYPLSLSNESPILAVSRASLDHLNKLIPDNNPAPASVFRANIILAPSGPGPEVPYDEDHWIGLRLQQSHQTDPSSVERGNDDITTTDLDVLGPCRRCQMVCIDQTTAERREEPFVTLAKTRRREGEGSKVFFGVHCALSPEAEGGGKGKKTIRVGDWVQPVRKGEDWAG